MKKYIRFEWDRYYPLGGLDNITGDSDTLEEAEQYSDSYDYGCVVDRDTWEEVSSKP